MSVEIRLGKNPQETELRWNGKKITTMSVNLTDGHGQSSLIVRIPPLSSTDESINIAEAISAEIPWAVLIVEDTSFILQAGGFQYDKE